MATDGRDSGFGRWSDPMEPTDFSIPEQSMDIHRILPNSMEPYDINEGNTKYTTEEVTLAVMTTSQMSSVSTLISMEEIMMMLQLPLQNGVDIV